MINLELTEREYALLTVGLYFGESIIKEHRREVIVFTAIFRQMFREMPQEELSTLTTKLNVKGFNPMEHFNELDKDQFIQEEQDNLCLALDVEGCKPEDHFTLPKDEENKDTLHFI